MQKKERIYQLDYLKGIFVLLMLVFHNSVIKEGGLPIAQAIYTFDIPGFMIISGYLTSIEKEAAAFGKGMMKWIVPYVIFESTYVVMIFYLGKIMKTSNEIASLSPSVMIDKVLLNPGGTYWYLHTLIICAVTYYLAYHLLKLKDMSGLAILGVGFFALSLLIKGFEMRNAMYFLIGVFIKTNGKNFLDTIKPSAFAAVPLCVLFLFPDNFDRGTLAGIAITILVISFLLFLYEYCPRKAKALLIYLGQNSLAIVVFSPIFTVICAKFIPYFDFDPTHLLFASVALVLTASGCLFCAWTCDQLGVSRFLFLKKRFYVGYKNGNDKSLFDQESAS